jgi:hypothetical protein
MRQRASIGIAFLALSHLASANVSSALAQAGSTGGTIGKQDKSISGGEEADRPRAASHPKRSAAKAQETSSGNSCGRIVGRWSWYLGMSETVFNQGGTVRAGSGVSGNWICTNTKFSAVFSNGIKERYEISQDGNSLSVTTTWGGGLSFKAARVE